MTDGTVTVAQLRERVRRFVAAREWERFHNPKDVAMALSIEASELMERFLWRPAADARGLDPAEREAVADELADVVIYALSLANAMELDLSDAVLRKMDRNEARYPPDRFKGVAP